VSKYISWLTVAATVLLVTPSAVAGLKDIHPEKLPQDEAVRKAYTDALSVEDMVHNWSEKWSYGTSKENVVSRLKASLDAFQKANVTNPGNEELLLLIGLVASYAYNVDVDGSHELAVDSLEKAHKLVPDDYRVGWFLGSHQCQTLDLTKEGMDNLLSVERLRPWEQLPSSFWDDYISCTAITNMPAHSLRAGDHLKMLHAPPSNYRDTVLDGARGRLKTPDPTATYSKEDAWSVKTVDSRSVVTNFVCGFSFSSPGEWRVARLDVQQGQCIVQLETGPYRNGTRDVVPNILVIVRQTKTGESLEDFKKLFMQKAPFKPASVRNCPSQECLTSEAVKPGLYGADGDGHAILTVFERRAPAFPGLALEEPTTLPSPEEGKTTHLHPNERLNRFEGTLYYLVLLDTASSVFDKAEYDFEDFLKRFQAE
jgi:hypothetical protein